MCVGETIIVCDNKKFGDISNRLDDHNRHHRFRRHHLNISGKLEDHKKNSL